MKTYPSLFGDIYTGNVSDGLEKVIEDLNVSTLFIHADENTFQLCVPRLKSVIDCDHIIRTRSGEGNKNLDTCRSVWSALIEGGADRESFVLNVGGGVIGDMGGFAAACYQRGIRFGHVPTTLLSMADAAIGGKLGVNYDGFKNYIGLIKPPSFIWVDETFLETLPQVEKISGLSEIVKHAIIGSPPLLEVLSGVEGIETMPWNKVLSLSIPVKVKIVESDGNELGLRKVLNFGHTIGHALESSFLTAGNPKSHGQCVALGMLVEARISQRIGLLNIPDYEVIIELIHRLLKPGTDVMPDFQNVMNWMKGDKKKSKNRVGFSLPDSIGSCHWDIPVDDQIINESYDWLVAQGKSVPFRLSVDK